MKNKLPKISEKEKDIMQVFWCSKEPLTASAVTEKGENLNINTVQVALRNLMKKGYIEIADIVYSRTVLTRRYKPTVSAEQYAADQLQAMQLNILNFSTLNFIDHLLNNDNLNMLDDLENLIKFKKKQEEN